MLVSDVNVDKIKELLMSVPSDIEIKSIDLTNGYELNLVAGEKQINDYNYKNALNLLSDILSIYDVNKDVKCIE